MTKINSNSPSISEEPSVDGGVAAGVEETASQGVDGDSISPGLPKDEIVEDEEGFFESLGKEAGKFVDDAVDTAGDIADRFEKAGEQFGLPDEFAHVEMPESDGPDLSEIVEKSGITTPLGARDEDREVIKEGVQMMRDLERFVDDVEQKIDDFKSENPKMATVLEVAEKGTHLDELLEVGSAGLEIVTAAGDAYETFIEGGRNPIQYVRNIPDAIDRVENNVNEAMKEAFGDDALQITLAPSLADLAYTAEGLIDVRSKVRTQIVAALTLGVVEVARENAHVLEAVADSKMASAVGEAVEEKADMIAALGALGGGMLLGPVGVIGGIAVASAILTDQIELPIPNEKSLKQFAVGLQENPDEYRDIAMLMTGPTPHQIESLGIEGELISEFSLGVDAGFGASVDGSVSTRVKSTRIAEDAHRVTIEYSGKAALEFGEKLQGIGLEANAFADNKVRVTLVVSGPESHSAVAALHRGDIAGAITTAVSAEGKGIEIENESGISGTGGLFKGKLARSFTVGIDDEKVSISSGVKMDVGAEIGPSLLRLPNPGDDKEARDFVGVWTELTKLEQSTHTRARVEVSARAAIEREHDGGTSLVFELGLGASREDFEAEGKLEVRVTDLEGLVKSTGLSAEELVKVAETKPERLLEFITNYDGDGVDVNADIRCRDLQEISGSLGEASGKRIRAEPWRDIKPGEFPAPAGNSFTDPRQYRV